jgi:putative membrane protein
LANERTFLAWVRTTLALLAAAAAVDALDLSLPDWLSTTVATVLALTALACAVQAWRGWMRTEAALRRRQPLPSNPVNIVVVVGVAAVALALTISVVTGAF